MRRSECHTRTRPEFTKNNPLSPLLDTLSRPMDVAGRVLLGLYFVIPGLLKVSEFTGTLAYMNLHGVPLAMSLLLLIIPLQVGAGLALIFDRQVRTAAFLLAAVTLLVNVFMHDFWNDYAGGNAQHELQNFIKNLGIFAGLLLLAAQRPGARCVANTP